MKYDYVDAKGILGDFLLKQGDADETVVLLSADSGRNSGFGAFMDKYPERVFELGIMEPAAVSVASGFALTGKKPVFASAAPFATGRAYEMFKVDLGYMQQNALIIGRNCGFNYSDLGPTHYGLDDYALIRLIPDVVILAPQDVGQLSGALVAGLKHEGPVYLRLGTAPIPRLYDDAPFEIGKGTVIREGKDVAIISTGEIAANVMQAVTRLEESGVDPMVVSMPTIHPIDRELVIQAAQKCRKIVTVEEHFNIGGLGTIISELCSEECPVPVKRLGAPHTYISAGPYQDLLKVSGLRPDDIVESVQAFLSVE